MFCPQKDIFLAKVSKKIELYTNCTKKNAFFCKKVVSDNFFREICT